MSGRRPPFFEPPTTGVLAVGPPRTSGGFAAREAEVIVRSDLGRPAAGFGLLALLIGLLAGPAAACERSRKDALPTGTEAQLSRLEGSLPAPRPAQLGPPNDGGSAAPHCDSASATRDRCSGCTARGSRRTAIVTLLRTLRVALRLLRRELQARLDDPATALPGGREGGARDEIVAVETGARLLAGASRLAFYNPLTS